MKKKNEKISEEKLNEMNTIRIEEKHFDNSTSPDSFISIKEDF